MTKREYCENRESIAYYSSGLWGVEIKGIEYGIEDYVYCVSGSNRYHRCKIYYSVASSPYFRVYGHKIPLNECIRN